MTHGLVKFELWFGTRIGQLSWVQNETGGVGMRQVGSEWDSWGQNWTVSVKMGQVGSELNSCCQNGAGESKWEK